MSAQVTTKIRLSRSPNYVEPGTAYLAAASLGLAAVFATVPVRYAAVKLAGAGYLARLAWKVLRPGRTSPVPP